MWCRPWIAVVMASSRSRGPGRIGAIAIRREHEGRIGFIRNMNTGNLDFDQLMVFDALLRERSVSAVARELRLPQPTVSRWLAQLRRFFDDPLFVRTRRGMEPTPVALGAAEAVHEIVHLYRVRLMHAGGFDPARSARHFTIPASDFGHLLVLPLLERHTPESAPHLTFTALP